MKYVMFFTCLLLILQARAQLQDSLQKPTLTDPAVPEFPGGHYSMISYLRDRITGKLDIAQIDLKSLRTAYASFVLDETGKVTKPAILKSSNSALVDSLFVAALKAMPRWSIPATNGTVVPQKINLPYTVLYR